MNDYFEHAAALVRRIQDTQTGAIARAADLIAPPLIAGGVWHVFGTGHSHAIAEELYYRAGGLACVNAILYPPLMQHEGPVTSTRLERTPGLAKQVLDRHELRPGEVLTVVSNSGKNAVPVEAAIAAKAAGLKTVAITSMAQSNAAALGEGQRHKLFEVCDVVIDNCGTAGDAALEQPGMDGAVCPTSTLAGVVIVQQLVWEIVQRFLEAGQTPPLYKTANLPGGDAWNAELVERYRDRIHLV